MTTVVAALVEQDGKLLICQRRRGDSFALKWEFPGGKARPGELLADALARELAEELGVTATIGHELYRTRHRYQKTAGEFKLIFFAASLQAKLVRNLAFERVEWVEPSALPTFDFLPANRELVRLLSTGALRAH